MSFKLSLKRINRPRPTPKLDVSTLESDSRLCQSFKKEVLHNLPSNPPTDLEEHYKIVVQSIQEAAKNTIPIVKKIRPSTHWFNAELRELLEQRRMAQSDQERYDMKNREFRTQCKEAKEKWLEGKCKEVECLSHNPKQMHKKIKEITGSTSTPPAKCIKAADGSVLQEAEDISARWEEYIQELFHEDQLEEDCLPDHTETGPSILKSEIRWALQKMRAGKAAGPDGVYTEMLKALGEDGIEVLWNVTNAVYETGKFPKEMLKSIFVTLPKIPGTLDCSSHRTISLMSHILKIILKVVLQRIRRQLLPEIPQHQFGFMPDRGTRNAIFVLRMLAERTIQHQQDLYLVFIDYQKAFDKVRHAELFKMLSAIKVDDKDMRIIRSVYRDQLAAVRLQEGTTNWFPIKRGVRQGCVMSPDLFNLYSETILRQLENRPEGLSINGIMINNLRYADDTVLLASSNEDLQSLYNAVVKSSEELGLHVNSKKTKAMVISKSEVIPDCHLLHGNATIEQVSSFNYLGALISSDARCKNEIKRRIGISKDAFWKLRQVLLDHKLAVKLKVRLMKAYVWSTLLYGCESWTLTAETQRNLEAVEMWYYRRMLRISYTEHVSNEEVLQRIGVKRELLLTIKTRQKKFLGHVIRKGAIEDLSLSGRIPGKRARGGQRKTFSDNFDLTARHLWDSARNRKEWRKLMVRQTPYR